MFLLQKKKKIISCRLSSEKWIMKKLNKQINLFIVPDKNTWWIMKLTGLKNEYSQAVVGNVIKKTVKQNKL